MIISESFGGRLTAFDVAPDGSLSRQRVWARLGDVPTEFHGDIPDTVALPDGLCLDAEGAIGRAYGAKTTPHMYVIDAKGIIRYKRIGPLTDPRSW